MLEKSCKNNKKELGNKGEDLVCEYLINNGYKIIERNFRCNQGEIDIIAMDKKEIVFIEVKTRRNMHYGKPIDSVDCYKRKHILDVANFYLYIHNLYKKYMRFDVIEVYVSLKNVKINHVKNCEFY